MAGDVFAKDMESALAEWPVPGLNAAVLVEDKVIWTHAAGLARVETGEPLSLAHRHRIGSITKLFTAHAVLLLHERGALSIDDSVSRWVPEFPETNPVVTLRHILCHGSGITSEGGRNVWESGDFPDEREFRDMIRSFHPVAPPMRHAKYSNAAVSMLGLVVAAASGQPYEKFLLSEVVAPLGMSETTFDLPDGAPFAHSHYLPPLERRFAQAPHQDLKAYSPCGMLLSTPRDLIQLARSQWSQPALLGDDLAREARRVQLVDPDTPGWHMGYGLGWRELRRGERIYIGHTGGYLGNYCALEIVPEEHVAVALFANLGGATPVVDMAMDMADATIQARGPRRRPAGGDPPSPEWQSLLGHYAMHRWGEATITFDGEALRFGGGDDPELDVPLRQESEGSFRILSGRQVGEILVIVERMPDGRVREFTFGGHRYTRI